MHSEPEQVTKMLEALRTRDDLAAEKLLPLVGPAGN